MEVTSLTATVTIYSFIHRSSTSAVCNGASFDTSMPGIAASVVNQILNLQISSRIPNVRACKVQHELSRSEPCKSG